MQGPQERVLSPVGSTGLERPFPRSFGTGSFPVGPGGDTVWLEWGSRSVNTGSPKTPVRLSSGLTQAFLDGRTYVSVWSQVSSWQGLARPGRPRTPCCRRRLVFGRTQPHEPRSCPHHPLPSRGLRLQGYRARGQGEKPSSPTGALTAAPAGPWRPGDPDWTTGRTHCPRVTRWPHIHLRLQTPRDSAQSWAPYRPCPGGWQSSGY